MAGRGYVPLGELQHRMAQLVDESQRAIASANTKEALVDQVA